MQLANYSEVLKSEALRKRNLGVYLPWVFAFVWIGFTTALAGWWIIFALRQIERLDKSELQGYRELARHHRMILWEGGALIICLIGAGALLTYHMIREMRQGRAIQQFLAVFTHELKTPIASLRLQAEVLAEEFGHSAMLDGLIADTGRLTMQLENSLFLAQKQARFFFESIVFGDACRRVAAQWPSLKLNLQGDALLRADARALDSVLQNLLYNSITHGKARSIIFSCHQCGPKVRIEVQDDGMGFAGDQNNLGKLFARSYTGSGSGVGLHLIKHLLSKMGGEFQMRDLRSGFQLALYIPGSLLDSKQTLEACNS